MKNLKHVKTFESWFKNPFKSDTVDGYKSRYTDISGKITGDEVLVYKTIDNLRDMGFGFKNRAGELTDSRDIWVKADGDYVILPDYDKSVLLVRPFNSRVKAGGIEVAFSSPDKMSEEISNYLNKSVNIKGYLD